MRNEKNKSSLLLRTPQLMEAHGSTCTDVNSIFLLLESIKGDSSFIWVIILLMLQGERQTFVVLAYILLYVWPKRWGGGGEQSYNLGSQPSDICSEIFAVIFPLSLPTGWKHYHFGNNFLFRTLHYSDLLLLSFTTALDAFFSYILLDRHTLVFLLNFPQPHSNTQFPSLPVFPTVLWSHSLLINSPAVPVSSLNIVATSWTSRKLMWERFLPSTKGCTCAHAPILCRLIRTVRGRSPRSSLLLLHHCFFPSHTKIPHYQNVWIQLFQLLSFVAMIIVNVPDSPVLGTNLRFLLPHVPPSSWMTSVF